MPRQPTTTRKKGRGPSIGDLQNTNPAKRLVIWLDEFDRWKPSRARIIRTIGCIMKRHLMGPYASWKMVPEEGKEKYLSVFKETYNWNPEQEDKIHKVFNKEIRVSMNRSFSVLHKELKAGEEKPEWLCEEHYKGLVEYWDTAAFKLRRIASVSNRSQGEKITHRFGSSHRDDNVNRASTISTDFYIKIRKRMPLSLRDEKWVDDYLLNPSCDKYESYHITRDSFLTLQPGMWVHGGVLDCLATVTSYQRLYSSDSNHWNLPTRFCTFAQRDDLTILDLERKVFGLSGFDIGRPDECLSVSIPIHDLNHWLLCRIDFEKMEIVICDTLRDHSADVRRKHLVLNAVKKLEHMSRVWRHGEFKVRGWIDTLTCVYSTTLPRQPNTYDCGIYVCLLMMFRDGVNRALLEEELASTRRRMAYMMYSANFLFSKDNLNDAFNGAFLEYSDTSPESESSNGVLTQHNQSETHVQTDIPTRIREPEIDAIDLETQETVERDENVTINQTEETTTPGNKHEDAKLTTAQPMPTGSNRLSQGETSSGVLTLHYQSETHVQTDIPTPVPEPDQRGIPTPFSGPEIDALHLGTQETVERDENVTINRTEETITPGSTREAAKLATEQPMVKCSDQYSDKVDEMSENGSGGTHQSPKNSIAECMSILNTIDGVEVCGKLWLYATTLFLKSDCRELFSALEPHSRKVWLEYMLERDVQK